MRPSPPTASSPTPSTSSTPPSSTPATASSVRASPSDPHQSASSELSGACCVPVRVVGVPTDPPVCHIQANRAEVVQDTSSETTRMSTSRDSTPNSSVKHSGPSAPQSCASSLSFFACRLRSPLAVRQRHRLQQIRPRHLRPPRRQPGAPRIPPRDRPQRRDRRSLQSLPRSPSLPRKRAVLRPARPSKLISTSTRFLPRRTNLLPLRLRE